VWQKKERHQKNSESSFKKTVVEEDTKEQRIDKFIRCTWWKVVDLRFPK